MKLLFTSYHICECGSPLAEEEETENGDDVAAMGLTRARSAQLKHHVERMQAKFQRYDGAGLDFFSRPGAGAAAKTKNE